MDRDQDSLLALIAALHAGASSRESWVKGLDLLSDLTGGSQILLGTTPHLNGPFGLVGHRMDHDIVEQINGPLASNEANPVFSCVPLSAVQQPIIISSALSEQSLLHSRIYNEALKPSGIRFTMALLLAADDEAALTVALGRPSRAGDYDEADAQLLTLLAPHLCSALQLQQQVAFSNAAAEALDIPDRGVLLISQSGRIRYANDAAARILSARDGLFDSPAGISGGSSREAARLRELIVEAAKASVGSGLSAGGYVALSRKSMRQPYMARVVPAAPPLQARYGLKPEPMALMVVRDVERQTPPSIECLNHVYGLTRMEAEVALEIYEGETIAELSVTLGISANTAKSHLRNVFQKVGVSRQAALVSRLAAAAGEG